LLESALAQPMASFGGHFAHPDLSSMAGAYLFHIVSNHPFVDGNKRAGLLAALVFLELNGILILSQTEALHELTLNVASGGFNKALTIERLREIITKSQN
ncbi:type II toxin-antitoxin system death-on-curing family toxin, partial [Myxococcota bacterium]|nr:type II toxin-antitoxin system death-on-curing family toxin [Myxococcota bacterium]